MDSNDRNGSNWANRVFSPWYLYSVRLLVMWFSSRNSIRRRVFSISKMHDMRSQCILKLLFSFAVVILIICIDHLYQLPYYVDFWRIAGLYLWITRVNHRSSIKPTRVLTHYFFINFKCWCKNTRTAVWVNIYWESKSLRTENQHINEVGMKRTSKQTVHFGM